MVSHYIKMEDLYVKIDYKAIFSFSRYTCYVSQITFEKSTSNIFSCF